MVVPNIAIQRGDHLFGYLLDHRNNHGIPELSVGLRIGDLIDLERLGVAHEACAFPRRQAPGVPATALFDQDLRTILVVACTKCACNVIWPDKAESESVAGRLVFGGIVLEILPEVIGQSVLLWHLVVQYLTQLGSFFRKYRPLEGTFLPEANNEDPFPVLWYQTLRINDPIVNVITKLFGQDLMDHFECVALIVALQVLHILQNEGLRSVMFEDISNVEEEVALPLIFKTMFPAKAVLLRNSGKAEWLAGKTGAQHIVRRNPLYQTRLGDVAVQRRVREIRGIGLLGIFVPIRSEDAFSSLPGEAEVETSDTTEEVDEFEQAGPMVHDRTMVASSLDLVLGPSLGCCGGRHLLSLLRRCLLVRLAHDLLDRSKFLYHMIVDAPGSFNFSTALRQGRYCRRSDPEYRFSRSHGNTVRHRPFVLVHCVPRLPQPWVQAPLASRS